jgi:hypothetical protein
MSTVTAADLLAAVKQHGDMLDKALSIADAEIAAAKASTTAPSPVSDPLLEQVQAELDALQAKTQAFIAKYAAPTTAADPAATAVDAPAVDATAAL